MSKKRILKEYEGLLRSKETKIASVELEDEWSRWEVAFLEDTTEEGRLYYFRVEFPKDYPFKPPMIRPLTQGGAAGSLLSHPLLGDEWSPHLTVAKAFETVVSPAVEDIRRKGDSIFRHLHAMLPRKEEDTFAYVGIGCGGPSLQQQLPLDVFLRPERRVVLVLVDRHLFKDEPLNRWRVEHSGTCSLYACSAFLTESDVGPLTELLVDKFDRAVVGDRRGASFGGAHHPLDLTTPPIAIDSNNYALQLPGFDDATRLVLGVTRHHRRSLVRRRTRQAMRLRVRGP